MDLNLIGKHAIVCGSTQGIGKAAAKELASQGARITLISRNEEKLQKVLNELEGETGHDYLSVDFSQPEVLKEKVREHVKENGPVHILVNNTGGPPGGKAIDADTSEFTDAFSAHLICNQILAQATVPGMKEAGYGRIINIISTSVKQPIPNLGVSNTVRGAVANWAKTLSMELGEFGITVNNILPGFTNTQRLDSIVENRSAKQGKDPSEVRKAMMDTVPAKRPAEPEETADAIAFLASPSAAYINGVNLPVDGGRTGSL